MLCYVVIHENDSTQHNTTQHVTYITIFRYISSFIIVLQ